MKVKKAVIPAAGLGTRFLPATKTVPKELLPIVDTPILLHVVEEAIGAGIEDLVIIAGRNKNAIEDFFDRSYELEDTLLKTGKTELLRRLQKIQAMVNVISVRQKEAKGLGHAVYMAKAVVGQEPFAVLLGDEIMVSTQPEHKNVTAQLSQIFLETQKSTVAVMEVSPTDVSKYGIIEIKSDLGPYWEVKSVVEKPSAELAPSRLALPGRYLFTSDLFTHLENQAPGKNGEIQLTDGMTQLAQGSGLLATSFACQRFDAGDKLGYLMANVEMGLRHPELAGAFKTYLQGLKL
jgi:UTP--glucose-1-phosphate uridylyltransferase